MHVEWDPAKSQLNLRKHGISFQDAALIFDNPVYSVLDQRNDYGEHRDISIGMIATTVVLVVVHTQRKGAIRIISARKANRREQSNYDDYFKATFEGH